MMIAAVVGIVLVGILVTYVVLLHRQLRGINRQLERRLEEHTRQPIRLLLFSRKLNTLAMNINRCLQAEENLRLQRVREEKRFKELMANLSHDLRTPLTAIKGYQQLLQAGELTEDQRRKLDIAQKHADRLGRLIDSVFEYAYLASAEPQLRPERLNLTNLVSDCLAAAVPALEAKRLSLRFDSAPPFYAMADREMTARILQNLVRNCVQHSSGDIEAALFPEANRIVVSFRNPVHRETALDADRLFDRLYTGDPARSGGTGLGLSIVKALAERMGGRAAAAMQDGHLVIRVELPAADPEAARAPASPQP